MPVKNLKFNEKENKDDDIHTARKSETDKSMLISGYANTLKNEREILAQEIVNLNREISKMRVSYF